MVRLAYNNAPTVINYFIDDFVDLNADQETWLKPRLTNMVAWHRANEMPRYAKLFADTKTKLGGTITASDIEALYLEGRASMNRTATFCIDDAQAFMAMLTPQQVDYLEKRLAKDNEKIEKEIARPLAKRKADRLKRYLERFDDQFGKLSPAQTERITATMKALPPYDELRLEDRKRSQQDMLKLLRNPLADATKMREAWLNMVTQAEARRTPQYQAEIINQSTRVAELTAWLANEASQKQKQHLMKQLDGYAEDIAALLTKN